MNNCLGPILYPQYGPPLWTPNMGHGTKIPINGYYFLNPDDILTIYITVFVNRELTRGPQNDSRGHKNSVE
jgi:hypothetical protein